MKYGKGKDCLVINKSISRNIFLCIKLLVFCLILFIYIFFVNILNENYYYIFINLNNLY